MTLRHYIIQEFGSMDEYMKFLQDWSTTCAELNRSVMHGTGASCKEG